MRSHLLSNPELAAYVNREFVPVHMVVTDTGFPGHVPALATVKELYENCGWTRMAFGLFVVMDPEGEDVYAYGGCQLVNMTWGSGIFGDAPQLLEQGLARFNELRALRKAGESDAWSARLSDLRADMANTLRTEMPCFSDRRLITARFMVGYGGSRWQDVVTVLSRSVPGVDIDPSTRNLILRNLGEFLVDERPFSREAEQHLKIFYATLEKADRREIMEAAAGSASGSPRPLHELASPDTLRRQCADALARIGGLPTEPDMAVQQATDWWKRHQGDPEFRTR